MGVGLGYFGKFLGDWWMNGGEGKYQSLLDEEATVDSESTDICCKLFDRNSE